MDHTGVNGEVWGLNARRQQNALESRYRESIQWQMGEGCPIRNDIA
ncbi:MAG: hypothetical protein K2I07_14480 [Lachnospiraceae bacterium]|nr:hypothetical protein [Lachnospiraceae bacterium]